MGSQRLRADRAAVHVEISPLVDNLEAAGGRDAEELYRVAVKPARPPVPAPARLSGKLIETARKDFQRSNQTRASAVSLTGEVRDLDRLLLNGFSQEREHESLDFVAERSDLVRPEVAEKLFLFLSQLSDSLEVFECHPPLCGTLDPILQ